MPLHLPSSGGEQSQEAAVETMQIVASETQPAEEEEVRQQQDGTGKGMNFPSNFYSHLKWSRRRMYM